MDGITTEPQIEAAPLALSFVFPCLNEEGTLETCIRQVKASLDTASINYEIIVADNGSTDRSREIAIDQGCRVIPIPQRGYGAALRGGIDAARGEYVMFADSDNTYMYEHAAPLYQAAKANHADMAIASRMKGKIEPGAMPFLHRWLGTPVLTTLINVLFRGKLSDCNSGFRCLKKSSYLSWDVRATGMEFASELLIKGLKHRAKTVDIPSGLRPGPPGRVAHLRTWRDGMRHLLFILSEKPSLFEKGGLLLVLFASLLQLVGAFTGPVSVWGFHILDVHSQAMLLLAGVFGAQVYVFSFNLYLRGEGNPLALTRGLVHLSEGTLFFLLAGIFAAAVSVVLWLGVQWSLVRFSGLHLANQLLVLVHFLSISSIFAFGLLGAHVLKKSRQSA